MGNAAQATHFIIGSGTKLAIEGAIGLAEKLHEHEDLQAALRAYEEERRATAPGGLRTSIATSTRTP
jgi:anthraniloyl-CoA monooxygenase